MYDLVVVGGGASGLMAAGRAAELGARVLLLEKNKTLGAKLAISGGGRCNITNAEYDERVLLKAYGKAEQFLYSLFAQFGVKDTFSFFESRGLPLVVEANKRVFPKTQKAADVVAALRAYAQAGGVTIKTSSPVTGVAGNGTEIISVQSGSKTYTAKQFIFATGGVSHPETGSTGEGFAWLKSLGHTVLPSTPTIVPLRVADAWIKMLKGIALPNIKITFFTGSQKTCLPAGRAFSKEGKLLCTHFGISGPLVLNSATAVADLLQAGPVTAAIDLYPKLDPGMLERHILKTFDANKNKTLKNVLRLLVPEGASKGILTLLPPKLIETKVHSILKEERKIIARTLKSLPLTIEGLMGFDRAVISDGGVPPAEVDFKTMRSKKTGNLFITGDLL
ncbi:MAG: aminoacetone oxidase family FAD-binding enzyme, partial [Patescibacteria group bacterium]